GAVAETVIRSTSRRSDALPMPLCWEEIVTRRPLWPPPDTTGRSAAASGSSAPVRGRRFARDRLARRIGLAPRHRDDRGECFFVVHERDAIGETLSFEHAGSSGEEGAFAPDVTEEQDRF